jgi:arginine decarboxylase
MNVSATDLFTTESAVELYGLDAWGNGYLAIGEHGSLLVTPTRESGRCIDVHRVVRMLAERGVRTPVLLRFPHLLESRIESLHESFWQAMASANYLGDYRGLYPMKVNQRQEVLEEVTTVGRRFHYGLEVGSKAELVGALGYLDDEEAYIVCNGYKDREYVELALGARKVGVPVVLVLETPAELELAWEAGVRLGVRPSLGIRLRLSQEGSGKWGGTSGEHGLYGFSIPDIVDVVDFLKERAGLDCLEMLHYHQGSQLPDVRAIGRAAREGARVYAGLVKEGAKMSVLNIGGGLAVDYDGSNTAYSSSKNYTLEAYCRMVVETVKEVCDEAGVSHPRIASESGRAVAAYYSVLVFNIMGVDLSEASGDQGGAAQVRSGARPGKQERKMAVQKSKDALRREFLAGIVSIRECAEAVRDSQRLAETTRSVVNRVSDETRFSSRAYGRDCDPGDGAREDFYYGNFSVFQSLPDHWAIGQMFPVMPLQRLNEEPDRRAVIADLTCDCDGKIRTYIDPHEERDALPVHSIGENEDYLIGVFLVGAYQETLGDMHNLYGRTHAVSIELRDGEIVASRTTRGNLIRDVLKYLEYRPAELVDQMRTLTKRAVAEHRISLEESEGILESYVNSLSSYTYFNMD